MEPRTPYDPTAPAGPPPLRPEDPRRHVRWIGAGFGLAVVLLLGLGVLWAVITSPGRFVLNATPTPSASSRATVTPHLSPTPSPSASPIPSASPGSTGTISGSVGYPAGSAPAQLVCAVATTAPAGTLGTCLTHPAGTDLPYSLKVTPGTYYVYARLVASQGDFTTTYRAYYDQYVKCQAAGETCTNAMHNQYLPVTVAAGQSVTSINPTDWYAQSSGQ